MTERSPEHVNSKNVLFLFTDISYLVVLLSATIQVVKAQNLAFITNQLEVPVKKSNTTVVGFKVKLILFNFIF